MEKSCRRKKETKKKVMETCPSVLTPDWLQDWCPYILNSPDRLPSRLGFFSAGSNRTGTGFVFFNGKKKKKSTEAWE